MTTQEAEFFGSVLRRRRVAAGLSQEELAERSGVSVRGIGDLEQDRRSAPRLTTVRLLADALRLDETGQRGTPRRGPAGPRHDLPGVAPAARAVANPADAPGRSSVCPGRGLRRAAPAGGAATDADRPGRGRKDTAGDRHGTGADCRLPRWDGIRRPGADSRARPGRDDRGPRFGLRDEGGQPLGERLRAVVADRALLLVLDNFEQVIDAAPLVADLVVACPRMKILATSRLPLRLAAEHLFPIAPLPPPADSTPPGDLSGNPAVALFMQRARAVRPELTLEPGECRGGRRGRAPARWSAPRDRVGRRPRPSVLTQGAPRPLNSRADDAGRWPS